MTAFKMKNITLLLCNCFLSGALGLCQEKLIKVHSNTVVKEAIILYDFKRFFFSPEPTRIKAGYDVSVELAKKEIDHVYPGRCLNDCQLLDCKSFCFL